MTEIQPDEILLIYNSDKSKEKRITGFAKVLPGLVIRTLDLAVESITETELSEIANKMDVSIEELIDPGFDNHIRIYKEGLNLVAPSDMLMFMTNDHRLIDTPIIVTESKACKVRSSYNQVREVLESIYNNYADVE